jgi:hypothetical protein
MCIAVPVGMDIANISARLARHVSVVSLRVS